MNALFDDTEEAEPIEAVAAYCEAHGWSHERAADEEVVATVQGSWASYELRAMWRADEGVLQLLVMPELRVLDQHRGAIYETLSLINEHLWLGHFEHWSTTGNLVYRHGLLLGMDDMLSLNVADTIIQTAIDECERFYPVFQFVMWGGKSPTEAIAAALIETRGEA